MSGLPAQSEYALGSGARGQGAGPGKLVAKEIEPRTTGIP